MNNMMKRWGLFSLFVVLSLALLAGCGSKSDESPKQQAQDETPTTETTDKTQGEEQDSHLFPVTFTDDVGREVTIEKDPETLISIQTSTTEILYALGAGDRLIGVSDYCNYPTEALEVQKVGGQDMDAELIMTLQPDVVFATKYHFDNHQDILKQYEEAGIKVVVTGSATSFEDAYQTMRMLAAATGTPDKAEEIIQDMKDRRAAIEEKAKEITEPKKVWVEVSPGPDIYTTGTNTFMHEMLETIHAVNAAADHEGWVKLTEEEIVALNPDVIITTYGYYVDNPAEGVLARDGWQEVNAIKNKQVFDVDSDTVTRPGPRLIEGVEQLAKLIYPEVFGE
ncbi:iron complex transport system substrate-binding protein [Sporosarcina luteola]|nr:iron complex transport system substrate-binding protein [Sporosarcina luteola]